VTRATLRALYSSGDIVLAKFKDSTLAMTLSDIFQDGEEKEAELLFGSFFAF
jgi:hypothetical protein